MSSKSGNGEWGMGNVGKQVSDAAPASDAVPTSRQPAFPTPHSLFPSSTSEPDLAQAARTPSTRCALSFPIPHSPLPLSAEAP